jgi:phenylalanyl-tRNA synthetase beta chain
MPTISYSKKELKELIGKRISDEQLEETISLIKPNVEESNENEILLEHNADRPDMFGVEGLARAVKSYLGLSRGLAKQTVVKGPLDVGMEKVPVRPFIACAVVKGVRMDDDFLKSLMNIQEILHDTIGRKRTKVAIGIHDLDKIEPPVVYSGASKTETFLPLESKDEMQLSEVLKDTDKGKAYAHILEGSRLWPAFKDSKGIFSFPPILNSERTKLTRDTKNLFVEVTGVEKKSVKDTINILVSNFQERGFKIESVRLEHGTKSETTPSIEESVVELNKEDVNRTLGLNLKTEDMLELAGRMGFGAVESGGKIEVLVPGYRVDVMHPVDVIEDIGIAYGYNNMQPKLPSMSTVGKFNDVEKLCDSVRNVMVGYGFQETLSQVLSNLPMQIHRMGWEQLKDDLVMIENPVSEDYTCMRIRVAPSLLKALSSNKHVEYPQNIFELGDVVWKDGGKDTYTNTVRCLAAAVCHSRAGFAEIKSVAEGLLKSLGADYEISNHNFPEMIPGRSAKITIDGEYAGCLGEVHPQVLENWNLEMPVAMMEIRLEN